MVPSNNEDSFILCLNESFCSVLFSSWGIDDQSVKRNKLEHKLTFRQRKILGEVLPDTPRIFPYFQVISEYPIGHFIPSLALDCKSAVLIHNVTPDTGRLNHPPKYRLLYS